MESLDDTMKEISAAMAQSLDKNLFDPNKKATQAQMCKIIEESINSTNVLGADSKVRVETTKHTWTSLYPSRERRLLAWLFYKCARKSIYTEQRWFHTVFPFKVTYAVDDFFESAYYLNLEHEADEADDVVAYQELKAAIAAYNDANVPRYKAKLAVPHETLEAFIAFKPLQPIKHIKLAMVVTPQGAKFETPKE